MNLKHVKLIIFLIAAIIKCHIASKPLVINTWNFQAAAKEAWELASKGESAVVALEAGCKVCERLQCEHTVGYGGSPDENGETTLDAMIFDGTTMNMGAVGGLKNIKSAISVAKHVLQNTKHSFLVGSSATDFAVQMGFERESLSTNYSKNVWEKWKNDSCQPNFWMNVEPNQESNCGPYSPVSENSVYYKHDENVFDSGNHDTIGMIVIDTNDNIVAGTSTNGANHKIPGRVGDSPIPGAGAYADSEVGAAVCTGDGDIMMRFLPSFLAVEEMRKGSTPAAAAATALARIVRWYPTFFGAVIAVNKNGDHAAACNGMEYFPYVLANLERDIVLIKTPCDSS